MNRNRARQHMLELMGVDAPGEERQRAGIRLVWEHVRSQRGRLVAGGILALSVSLTTLALPELVGATVDATIAGHVRWQVMAVAAVAVASTAAMAVSAPLLESVHAAGVASLARDLVRQALRLGIPGRRGFEHGDLLNRSAGDVTSSVRYATVGVELATRALVAIGGVIGLALVHWSFLLILAAGVAALMVVAKRVLATFPPLIADYREQVGRLASRYVDAQRGLRTIQASGTLDREVARITQPLADVSRAGHRMTVAQGTLGAQVSALFDLARVAIVALGGLLLARVTITPGDILVALAYSSFAMGSLIDLLDRGAFQLTASRVSAARVAEVVHSPEATPPPAPGLAAPAPSRLDGSAVLEEIEVDGSPRLILDRLDLDIPPGATVAIVGRSGAGKSTIAALTGRLLDPDAGTVRLGGIDVRDLAPTDLGSLVTYAFEQPTLLGHTVADTIAYGTDAGRDEVTSAAATAAAADFIERMPLGYDTPIGDAPLSGGERQRLGLARAAVRPGPILVLDDATSSLDTATEARVHASFTQMAEGRTTLIVAHRASTAARADLVAWLVDGAIRAIAPHEQLWADPAYRAVFSRAGDEGGEAAG